MKIEKRLEELGVELPPPAIPVANYVTTVQTEILFLHLDTVLARVKVQFIRANSAQMQPLKRVMPLHAKLQSVW